VEFVKFTMASDMLRLATGVYVDRIAMLARSHLVKHPATRIPEAA
jgi:hypothetical protein